MTVDERLFVAGKRDRFDAAARKGDRQQMIRILLDVELSNSQAAETADAILADPGQYGYEST